MAEFDGKQGTDPDFRENRGLSPLQMERAARGGPVVHSNVGLAGCESTGWLQTDRPDCGQRPIWLRYGFGFTGAPLIQTSKCRCEPVEWPVEPTLAISSPAWTRSPTFTSSFEQCP